MSVKKETRSITAYVDRLNGTRETICLEVESNCSLVIAIKSLIPAIGDSARVYPASAFPIPAGRPSVINMLGMMIINKSSHSQFLRYASGIQS